jgi:hypothetical protein
MLLTKLPVPVPSDVLLFAIVGPVEILQQTPRTVTEAPPSLVMLPPLVAVVEVMEVIAVVVRVGIEAARVEKFISFPYTVPLPLLKYALM